MIFLSSYGKTAQLELVKYENFFFIIKTTQSSLFSSRKRLILQVTRHLQSAYNFSSEKASFPSEIRLDLDKLRDELKNKQASRTRPSTDLCVFIKKLKTLSCDMFQMFLIRVFLVIGSVYFRYKNVFYRLIYEFGTLTRKWLTLVTPWSVRSSHRLESGSNANIDTVSVSNQTCLHRKYCLGFNYHRHKLISVTKYNYLLLLLLIIKTNESFQSLFLDFH